MYRGLSVELKPFLFSVIHTYASFAVSRDILLRMEKRNLIILISAVVIVLGVILATKYFDKFNTKIEAPVADVFPEEKTFKNISLPPLPTTSTISNTIKLPEPPSPQQQQEAVKKITLPPPPAE